MKLKKSEKVFYVTLSAACILMLVYVIQAYFPHYQFAFLMGYENKSGFWLSNLLNFFTSYGTVGLLGWLSLAALIIYTPYAAFNKSSQRSSTLFFGITRSIYLFFLLCIADQCFNFYASCEKPAIAVTIVSYQVIEAAISFILGNLIILFCTCFVILITQQSPRFSPISAVSLILAIADILLLPVIYYAFCTINKLSI